MIQVAVSILNYNSTQSTIACVQSLLEADQSAKNGHQLNIFVADNGSGGDHPEKLSLGMAGKPGIQLTLNPENLGFAAGHNRNIEAIFSRMSPDYIWLLNNDCEIDKKALAALLDSAQANPQVGIWGATLVEEDDKTIQCAGGCVYNSWLSTFRRFGRGKSVFRRDRIREKQLDYMAGASLFFPAAALESGFEPIPTLPGHEAAAAGHYLNENYFLYFEELDLAKRLKPDLEMAWCRDALIRHEGGISAGTRHNKRSATAEYHSTLSALKYTKFYYPRRLWFVGSARYLLKSLLLVFIFEFQLLKPLTLAYRDFRRWLLAAGRALKPAQSEDALITVVVPSLNQGRFLNDTLASIFEQDLPLEVFVMDGGSEDDSLDIIRKWEPRLAGWRSHPDDGQAAAINEGIKRGTAPYVCWLNSDDFFYPNGLRKLLHALRKNPRSQFTYGRCWAVSKTGRKISPYLTMSFSQRLFANFCFIAQPSTLVTRAAWTEMGGLNENMHLAFDYDMWWRLSRRYGPPEYCRNFAAATRMHRDTKTASNIEEHYLESTQVVERNWGSVPLKWRAALPIMKIVRKFS